MPDQDRTIDFLKTQVSKLSLSPGDYLVLRYHEPLTERAVQNLRDTLQTAFPEHRAVVLEGSMSLEAVKPQDIV